jgi:hypothetical protein
LRRLALALRKLAHLCSAIFYLSVMKRSSFLRVGTSRHNYLELGIYLIYKSKPLKAYMDAETLSITTFSVTIKNVTLSITTLNAKCHYSERHLNDFQHNNKKRDNQDNNTEC